MVKLIKYEFRKQVFSKIVMLVLVGLLELLFLFGIITDNEGRLGFSMGLLAMLSMGCLFFVAFESILTYSNDLKTKCSYMLFLTPNSSYKIVGAKAITAAVQIILVGAAFIVIALIDGGILLAKYQDIEYAWEMFKLLLNDVLSISVDMKIVILYISTLIISWVCTICVAFFSITLSTTFLANKKWKGIVSFIIFLGLNWLFNKIISVTLGSTFDYSTGHYILNLLYQLLFAIATFVGTGFMLEKKVSV